jgi:hypothetical protein
MLDSASLVYEILRFSVPRHSGGLGKPACFRGDLPTILIVQQVS